ncbi:hypothetical protein OUZ56_026626 [Daphnia magna]|uniref:Uncharacterized protein n=1 Tax=Daphnia magna TaxID=35525 RepID=A0ABQ9ZNB2_9CRUS|nr:hypothetical protein OUZ56_026626 [Daphnia magna]
MSGPADDGTRFGNFSGVFPVSPTEPMFHTSALLGRSPELPFDHEIAIDDLDLDPTPIEAIHIALIATYLGLSWVFNIVVPQVAKTNNIRVCNAHFVLGKPF